MVCSITEIMDPPRSVNISLNEERVLTCTAIGDVINWKANNTRVEEINIPEISPAIPIPINKTKSELKGQLHAIGSQIINHTWIECSVLQFSNQPFSIASSEPVLILVQGICIMLWCNTTCIFIISGIIMHV